MVDPQHRPQLIQSLCKVSYIKADLIHQLIKEAGIPTASLPAAQSRTPAARSKEVYSHQKAMVVTTTTSPSPSSTCSSTASSSSARSNLPDPKLFPFLSRRLAPYGSQAPPSSSASGPDGPDVDAATAMLALGQSLVQQPRSNGAQSSKAVVKNEPMDSWSPSSQTSSPADDHTYSFNSPRPVISPSSNSGNKSGANGNLVVYPKRPFQQHEVVQHVPDMVRT